MAAVITQKERKRRIWTLVICGFFTLLGLILGIVSMSKVSNLEKDPETPDNLLELNTKIEEIEPRIRDLKRVLAEWSDPFRSHHYANDTVDRFPSMLLNNDALKDLLDLYGSQLTSVFRTTPSFDPYFTTKTGKAKRWEPQRMRILVDPETQERTVEFYGAEEVDEEIEEELRVPNTGANRLWLTEILNMGVKERKELDAAAEQHKRDALAAEQVEKDTLEKLEAADRAKVEEIPPLIARLGDLLSTFAAAERDHYVEIKNLEEQLANERVELHKLLIENAKVEQAALAEITEYKTRIRHIKHRLEEEEERKTPDGYILYINPQDQVVHTNLTIRDKVFNYWRFNVYRVEKGQQRVLKGIITIVDLGDRWSIGLVDRVFDEKNPIKAGDIIYSIRYDKKQANYFVFAGKPTKFSRVEIEHKLLEMGDVFQERIDERTTYCIAGLGYEQDPIYREAIEKGLRVYAERYLYGYMGFPQ
jgi:hypothetical protein